MSWLTLIGWGLVAVVALAVLGFGRPVVEAITRTWVEFALPILRKVAESVYGRAAVLGLVAFGLLVLTAWQFDRRGYARAKGECSVDISTRERDEARAALDRARARLAELEQIRQIDATTAMADAETMRRNQARTDALPNSPSPCFDIPTARGLWGDGK